MAEPTSSDTSDGANGSGPSGGAAPWLVAIALAQFVALAGGAWFVGRRLTALEDKTEERLSAVEQRLARPARGTPAVPGKSDEPLGPADAKGIQQAIAKLSADSYDYYGDLSQSLYDLKTKVRQITASLKSLRDGLARPGAPTGTWSLSAADRAPSKEALEKYRQDAEAFGVRVSPGRVEVRGFLNMSPNTAMPIEYFVTRWPESGHETLVHVVGNVEADERMTSDRLNGLVTAVYKGLVVAGFMQGKGSGWSGSPDDPDKRPTWVPPTGDTVHVGIRYSLHGATHVARATDWVIDPVAKDGKPGVLAEDSLRFTGSLRIESLQTGDEVLSAEESGLVVSVYRNPNSLVEIALPSNLRDEYAYNFRRIPKPVIVKMNDEKDGPRLDVVRDRASGTLTVLGLIGTDRTVPLAEAPTLLLRPEEGEEPVAVPFSRSSDGGAPTWTVVDERLKSGSDWRIRATIDGKTVDSVGLEPLYLDLILSKTPVKTEGDGARPIEPIPVEKPPEPVEKPPK